jgi:hypothetical protein
MLHTVTGQWHRNLKAVFNSAARRGLDEPQIVARQGGIMFTVTASVEISRSTVEVFAFAGDYRNDPAWRTGVTEMIVEGGTSPAVGARTRETMKVLGRTAITVVEITEFSDTRTSFRSISGPVQCEGSRQFASTSSGTRMTYSLTLDPKGFQKLLEPLLAMLFRKQVDADLRRLKRILETGASAG